MRDHDGNLDFEQAGACLATDEIFAEQFAMYATGEQRSMTTYRVPQLLGSTP